LAVARAVSTRLQSQSLALHHSAQRILFAETPTWRQSHWDEAKAARIAAPPNLQLWSLELSDTVHAMRELPDHQREALVLVAAGGLSYEDAAAICDVPVGTVKSRVARGRTALINKLSGCEKIARSKAVRPAGAMDDILVQLSALTPAGAPCAAYA